MVSKIPQKPIVALQKITLHSTPIDSENVAQHYSYHSAGSGTFTAHDARHQYYEPK